MKVSSVKVTLTNNDIMAIIKEYVKIEGLFINEIIINDLISVSGSFKKGLDLNFKLLLGLGNIYDNMITLKIFDISIGKMGVPNAVKKIAIKKIAENFIDYGISVEKDYVKVDLDRVVKFIPNVYFKLRNVSVKQNIIEAEVDEFIYAANKEVEVVRKEKSKLADRKAVEDGYSSARSTLESKIPDKYKKVAEYALLIPDIIALLWRLLRDKRVSFKTKAIVLGIFGYLVSPLDLVPDFIPYIGAIDDVAIAFFGISIILNDIPENVILENWQGKENIIQKVKEVVNIISNVVGVQNVNRLVEFIKKLYRKENNMVKQNEECNNIH